MNEDLLKKAVEEAMEEDMSFIPKRQELEEMHEFSEKFDKKVRRMAVPKKIQRFRYQKAMSVVAACLAVVILAGVFSQTYLPSSKSSDLASSESSTAEQTDGAVNYEDVTDYVEESEKDGSESVMESEVLENSITGDNGTKQNSVEDERLQMNDSGGQMVEDTFMEELLQQREKIICDSYQIDGDTCRIWFEHKEITFSAAKIVVYVCMENGEWYQYKTPYTVQTEENGDICVKLEGLPNEAYTALYVMVEDMVVVMEKK